MNITRINKSGGRLLFLSGSTEMMSAPCTDFLSVYPLEDKVHISDTPTPFDDGEAIVLIASEVTNVNGVAFSGDKYALFDAVKPLMDGGSGLAYTAEDADNKETTMSGNEASDIKYLSAKAVYDWVTGRISALVNGAGAALDTLNELATALGNDPNFATTIATLIGLKAPINNPTFTGTVAGVTKTHVGLSNVDNTSDANKPVSTAQATAIGLKVDATEYKLSLELMSGVLTATFYAPYAMAINTVTNVLNSPTTTITVGGSAYTLGNAITLGQAIAVTVSTASVIRLNCTK